MRLKPLIPLLLIAWPIAEIATLIWVGGRLGVVNTIGLVLLAAFGGFTLFRYVGFSLLRRVQAELAASRMPAGTLLEGLVVLLAGFLLILPGFLSDIFAFLLLFGPIRKLIITAIAARLSVTAASDGPSPHRDDVIDLDEGDWKSRDDGRQGGASPWAGEPVILPPDRGGDRP